MAFVVPDPVFVLEEVVSVDLAAVTAVAAVVVGLLFCLALLSTSRVRTGIDGSFDFDGLTIPAVTTTTTLCYSPIYKRC